MNMSEIVPALFSNQDLTYRDFHANLLPNIPKERIIGVRIPVIRSLAKEVEDTRSFLQELPHAYYEENQLHACILNREKDFAKAVAGVNAFLPFVDNWATCDILNPAAFKKNPEKVLPLAMDWAQYSQTYTMRFGVEMLMSHGLDGCFDEAYLHLVSTLRPEDYYGRMMIAWYFATALAKQYDAAVPYLENRSLEHWTHNKTIQKAVESYRIAPEQKAYLKTLRLHGFSLR